MTSRMLIDLHLEGCVGLWEIACAPHSWLSDAAEQQGLRPQRMHLQQGYDLYKRNTWTELGKLRQQRHPRRLWFSLPCTKWCSWTSANYNTDQRREQLETDRRKERRMLWEAVEYMTRILRFRCTLSGPFPVSAGVKLPYSIWRPSCKNAVLPGYNVALMDVAMDFEIGMMISSFTRSGW